jgi:hypothetical protein
MQSNAGVLQTSFFTMFLYRTVIFTELINNGGKLKKAAWFQHRLVFSKEHVSKMDDEQLLTLAFSDRQTQLRMRAPPFQPILFEKLYSVQETGRGQLSEIQ